MVEMKSPTTATLWLNRDRVQSKDYIGPVKKLAHRQKKNLLTEVVKILLTIKIKFCLPYRLKSAYRTEKKVLTEIVKKVLDFYNSTAPQWSTCPKATKNIWNGTVIVFANGLSE